MNQSVVSEALQQPCFFAGQLTGMKTQILQKPKKYLDANLKMPKTRITGHINNPMQKLIDGEKRKPLSTISQVQSRVRSTSSIQKLTLPVFGVKIPQKPIVYIDQSNKVDSQSKEKKSQSTIPINISTLSIESIPALVQQYITIQAIYRPTMLRERRIT